jgi:hypothetical protein
MRRIFDVIDRGLVPALREALEVFDEFAREVGLGSHRRGVTCPTERARLRAELDGLSAHLYGLTEEFVSVLSTLSVVPDPIKEAAHNAFRDVARGLVR